MKIHDLDVIIRQIVRDEVLTLLLEFHEKLNHHSARRDSLTDRRNELFAITDVIYKMREKLREKEESAAKEFTEKMREIAKDPDHENAHGEADKLIMEILRQEGYGEGINIFDEMIKWYA